MTTAEINKTMLQSKTIEDWNFRREQLKRTITPKQLATLDSSGLIKKCNLPKHRIRDEQN